MPTVALLLALLLAACTSPTTLREGPVVPGDYPQAERQCLDQPELPWCGR